MFYVALIVALFAVAMTWVFAIASRIELDLFLNRIMISFLYIGIGFFFYSSGYPEKISSNYWVHIVA
jgi:hypothetical protein